MLKTRILTAIVLLAILAAASWFSPLALLACAAFLTGAALFEWLRLAGLNPVNSAALATIWVGGGFTFEALGIPLPPAAMALLMLASFAAWALVAFAIVRAQQAGPPLPVALLRLAAFFFCACAWFALVALLREGVVWTLSVMAVVWVADISAYAAGRAFGRRKLASRVSPGKTWEGVWGAMAGVILIAAGVHAALPGAALWTSRLLEASIPGGSLLLAFVVAASILGDLFESLVKRQAGAKDSGVLLPGHGGVWDRIDALLPALPLAVLVDELVRSW
jgi:phosphatidate cytidylyltransferase